MTKVLQESLPGLGGEPVALVSSGLVDVAIDVEVSCTEIRQLAVTIRGGEGAGKIKSFSWISREDKEFCLQPIWVKVEIDKESTNR